MKRLQQDFLQQIGDLRAMLDALDHIPGAMFLIKDLDSRYIYMSRALREAVHLDGNFEVVGKTDFDLFPMIMAQSFRQNDRAVFKNGNPILHEVHVVGFFNHAMKWAYSSKFPLRDRKGKVMGLISIKEEYSKLVGADAELNRLLPAIQHVTENYAERITIGQLAKLCGYSESQFTRVFKQRLKMTAYAFVEQVRMHHALDALQHSARSISDIAVDCGFYDHSAFVKRFKKSTGTTPLRHRRVQQARYKTTRTITIAKPATRC